jgi:ketosteroid isomerase-like protein
MPSRSRRRTRGAGRTLAALLAWGALACAGVPASAVRQDAAAAMVAADDAFSDACARHDPAATGDLVAEDAVFIGRRGLLRGRAGVLEGWKPLLTEGGPVLQWVATRADASNAGDLGFTVGEWRLESEDGRVSTGEYVTVWRRDGDGRLRALFDGPLREDRLEARPRVAVREVHSKDGDLRAEIGTLSRDGGEGDAAYLVVWRTRGGGSSPAVETVVPISNSEPEP